MAEANFIASADNRHEKMTNVTSKDDISLDAPALLPLLTQCPHLNIITPSSSTFEKFNEIYQQDTTAVPLALIRPTTADEVADIVRFATSASPPIQITVRAGGHDLYARSNIHGSLIIDMKEIDTIELAADKKSVILGGGTIGINLAKSLEKYGLITALGGCHSVGYAGWATAGGYGGLNGALGLGVDQILGATLVSPKGDIIEADDELLWALRGGGCNFGVITSLKIKVETMPKVLAGVIVFPLSEAKKVLLRYQGLLDKDFPDAYGGELVLSPLPGLGKALIFSYTWASSDLETGVQFADKIRALGSVAMDTLLTFVLSNSSSLV
ncbi:FAD-linked oxidoreductase aurO [Lachnellula suecica]|uniref:FAD-linked oxidoreductase aurO n=1 Tax=Lachnellula suecica TaxID=602035 RepID=A0A8T9BU85_9HELO|nr:FAD-linked oxidoreductase aurO [Lachnellula suecica]